MLKEVSRILLIRGDKIGDVTLITPAICALREAQPSARIVVMVRKEVEEVLEGNPHVDHVLSYDRDRHSGVIGFFRLWRDFRKEQFQVVVTFQGTCQIALATFFSWIPYRIGPLSKWWSFILYNMGIRQSRSNVEMHEADYNMQLLRDLGVSVAKANFPVELFVRDSSRKVAAVFFHDRGLDNGYKTVAIHPGMAGSALNWPIQHYIRLGRRLIKRYNIIITGGPEDKELVEKLLQHISSVHSYDVNQPVLTKYAGEQSIQDFMAILERCDGIVVPSTGPLHLSVGLKRKVITVFSPIRVQSALRWGPYGVSLGHNLGISPKDQASVLVPDVNCSEEFKCALAACIYYPCMPRISVSDVETQLGVMIEGGEISMFKGGAAASERVEELDEFHDEEIEEQY